MSARSRNRLCREFSATGHCTYGKRCRFAHNTVQVEVSLGRKQREPTEAELEAECQIREAQLLAERKMKQMETAEREAGVTLKQVVMEGSMLVTCGAGLDIQHIVCGFDSCFVVIKNLPRHVKRHEIEELITEQGVDTVFFCIVKMRHGNDEVEAKVMSDSGHGQVIAAHLDGMEFQDKVLDTAIDNSGVRNKMDTASERNVNVLAITWKLPAVTMVAYFISPNDALNAVRKLNNTIFCGRKIRAEIPHSTPFYTSNTSVRIRGLAPTVTTTELMSHSGAYLVATKSALPTFDNKDVEKKLKQIMERKQGFESYEATPPNPNKLFAEARVRFRTWDDTKRAQDSMEGQILPQGYPQLRFSLPPVHYVITIPLSQYRAQKGRWDSLPVEGHGNKGAFVQITNDSTDKAFIRVLGEDKKTVGQLKVRVESLVAGETLDLRLWHRSFMGAAGIRLLEGISARTKTYVRGDWKSKTLKLYADGNAKQAVINLVKAEIEHLEALEWPVSVHHCAIGFFMRKGLPTLQEELGEDAATLELLPTPRLIIRGGEEARRTVDRLIEESRVGIESESRDIEQDACPICFDEIMAPVMLTCGHFYCAACLYHFLSSAVERKTFPLVCLGDEDRCKAPIAIPVIQRHLPQQQFDRLVDMVVTTYVEKQPTKFKYCTTPDCPQVYRCEEGGSLMCPSCFVIVCTGCHKETHEGMTCREREIMSNPEEQERLNDEWAQAARAKRCPSCRVWIQKTEGCNHMTCLCGVHLCWLCLSTFPEGQSVYTHMNTVHGGISGDGVQHAQLAQEQADLALARRLQAEEDGVRQRRAEQEAYQRIVEHEDRQRRAEQEDRQRMVEHEARQRRAEHEAYQRIVEHEDRQRRAEHEAYQRIVEHEDRQRRAEQEAYQRIVEHEDHQRRAEQEDRQRIVEHEARQRRAEEEARQRVVEQEARQHRAEEEARQRVVEQEARQRRAEEEAHQPVVEQEARQRGAEEEARQPVVEQEAHQRRAEQEDCQLIVEYEARQRRAEHDARQHVVEQEPHWQCREEEARAREIREMEQRDPENESCGCCITM